MKKFLFGKACVFLLVILLFAFSSNASLAQDASTYLGNLTVAINNAKQQLSIERERLSKAKKALSQFPKEKPARLKIFITKGMSHNDLARSALAIASTQAAIGNVQIAIIDANEDISFTQNALEDLKKRTQDPEYLSHTVPSSLILQIAKQRRALQSLLDVQKKRIVNINLLKDIMQKRLLLFTEWHNEIKSIYSSQLKQRKQKRLIVLESKLQQQQSDWLQKLSKHYQQHDAVSADDPSAEQKKASLQIQIFLTQEHN